MSMNAVWNQVSRLAVVLVMLLGLLAMGPLASAAPGGNSGAAKACQQGGYAGLVGVQNGAVTSFADTSQCVSYAAQGGQLVALSIAQPCLNGGYAGLARTEDNTTAFTSEAECVSYAVGGGTLVPRVVPAPSITLSLQPSTTIPIPTSCDVFITLRNFAPGTYEVVTAVTRFGTLTSIRTQVTVDESGVYGPSTQFPSQPSSDRIMYTVTAGGVTAGPVTGAC